MPESETRTSRNITMLLAFGALAVASGDLACGSSSNGGGGSRSGDGGSSSGSSSGSLTASRSGSRSGSTGSSSACSSSSESSSRSSGGSDGGACSASGTFQCPPPSAGCLGVDAGGSGFVMCNVGQICVTTDECDLSVQGAGCVDVPAAQPCAPCATAEATLSNMGCPPSWSLNTTYTVGTPATGCTVDCN